MWPKKSGEVESRNSLSLPQNEIRLQRQKCWKSSGVLWEGALPLLAVPSPCWDGAGGSPLAPGLGSSLSSTEGTEADKVLNSHIKKKKIPAPGGAPGDGQHGPGGCHGAGCGAARVMLLVSSHNA